MNKLPLARSADIVVQKFGQEVLVYDLKTHKAYNLNETSSVVYNACDGKTSFAELKARYKFSDDLIFLALDELKKENLIESGSSFVSPFAGMSRREAIRKVGIGTMVALPLISSLVAPTAAQAQSGVVTCTANSCFCTFPDSDTTTTTCSSASCSEPGCLCEVSRNACSPGEALNTIDCFGSCAVDTV